MPTTTLRTDLDGLFAWDTIETTVDDDGTLLEKVTVFDNGIALIALIASFEGGVITQTVRTDNIVELGQPAVDGGVKSWEEIVAQFDENGLITSRSTNFDNGIRRFEQFENGERTFSALQDNFAEGNVPPADGGAKSWQEILIFYDQNGDVGSRDTTFDNGVGRIEEFENGVRTATFEVDNQTLDGVPAADGGAKAWSFRSTIFDEAGEIVRRSIEMDNGVTHDEFFENGVRTFTVSLDNFEFVGAPPADSGAKPWAEIFKSYDTEGELARKETVFDDADVLIFNFEGGERTNRVDIDVDNDQSWLVRETGFGESGNVVVTYDVIEDVPEQYLSYFDDILV